MTATSRPLRALLTPVLLVLLVLGLALPAAAEPERAPQDRLAGTDRYSTAVTISREAFPAEFPQGTGTVYLARGDFFADALAGGALTDGPVLLVRPCGTVPSAVLSEVARLDPARVVALGGAGAVCDTVLQQAADGRPTGRLTGSNRYATAVAISRRAFPGATVPELYVPRTQSPAVS